MPLERRALYLAGSAAIFIALIYVLSPVLAPFLFGIVLAYLLDPAVTWLEGKGLSRIAASILILVLGAAVMALGAALIVPPLITEFRGFIAEAPSLFERLRGFLMARLPLGTLDGGGSALGAAKELGGGALKGLAFGGSALIQALTVLLGAPIIALYLLIDWERMIARIDDLLPRDLAPTIRLLAGRIDEVLSDFLRGQLLVCALLGGFYALSLGLIGLKYGVLIGIAAGVMCFVPFVGSALGFLAATGMALSQYWGEWWLVGLVAGVFVIGQLVEGNILTPYLVGGRVGLHPVWLLFALSAFGYLLGFTGLVLAVPLAAAVGVLTRWGAERYRASALYKGG